MKEKPPVTVLQFFDALAESGVLKGETWMPWRAFLGALFGLPLSAEEAALAAQCTGRADLPAAAFSEAWLVCGRRSGKSFVLALVAVFLACFRDFRAHLGPGERATIMVIATDRKQARTIYRFASALLTIPQFARLVTRRTAEQIHLRTGAAIEIHTATFRRTRGYAIAAALLDARRDGAERNPAEASLSVRVGPKDNAAAQWRRQQQMTGSIDHREMKHADDEGPHHDSP